LRVFHDELSHKGVAVVLVHAQESLLADLERHRLKDVIGTDHVFDSLHEALAAIHGQRLRGVEDRKSGAG
jgi:predicted nuclease with RNAse H fold